VGSNPTPSAIPARPRSDQRGVDLIFDVLPFGRLWYGEPNAVANEIGYHSITAAHMMP
jgi:hypothetical protein